MSLGVRLSRCHAVCVSAALVSTVKVMRCIQCSLVLLSDHFLADSYNSFKKLLLTIPKYVRTVKRSRKFTSLDDWNKTAAKPDAVSSVL